ncbi:ACP-like domain-containing protein [Ursidibacter arcticus]
MKHLTYTLIPTALLGFSLLTHAQTAQEAADSTVVTKLVKYSCDQKKQVSVTYGFNEQGLPTYAQFNYGGKQRFMPINLNRSDNVDLIFGDENNFSLTTDAFDSKTYHSKSIMIMTPNNEIVYNNCKPR